MSMTPYHLFLQLNGSKKEELELEVEGSQKIHDIILYYFQQKLMIKQYHQCNCYSKNLNRILNPNLTLQEELKYIKEDRFLITKGEQLQQSSIIFSGNIFNVQIMMQQGEQNKNQRSRNTNNYQYQHPQDQQYKQSAHQQLNQQNQELTLFLNYQRNQITVTVENNCSVDEIKNFFIEQFQIQDNYFQMVAKPQNILLTNMNKTLRELNIQTQSVISIIPQQISINPPQILLDQSINNNKNYDIELILENKQSHKLTLSSQDTGCDIIQRFYNNIEQTKKEVGLYTQDYSRSLQPYQTLLSFFGHTFQNKLFLKKFEENQICVIAQFNDQVKMLFFDIFKDDLWKLKICLAQQFQINEQLNIKYLEIFNFFWRIEFTSLEKRLQALSTRNTSQQHFKDSTIEIIMNLYQIIINFNAYSKFLQQYTVFDLKSGFWVFVQLIANIEFKIYLSPVIDMNIDLIEKAIKIQNDYFKLSVVIQLVLSILIVE